MSCISIIMRLDFKCKKKMLHDACAMDAANLNAERRQGKVYLLRVKSKERRMAVRSKSQDVLFMESL